MLIAMVFYVIGSMVNKVCLFSMGVLAHFETERFLRDFRRGDFRKCAATVQKNKGKIIENSLMYSSVKAEYLIFAYGNIYSRKYFNEHMEIAIRRLRSGRISRFDFAFICYYFAKKYDVELEGISELITIEDLNFDKTSDWIRCRFEF